MNTRQPRYSQIFQSHDYGAAKAEMACVLWAEVKSHLEDNSLMTKTRLRQADRYVRACVEYEFLYPEAMSDGPTLTAESGGQYANMKWSAVGKLSEQILKMEASMLISPQSADGKLASPKKAGKSAAETKWLKSA